jgi:predicted RNA-binding Zn-ribbon protein involved in translation (DUF1610 family)
MSIPCILCKRNLPDGTPAYVFACPECQEAERAADRAHHRVVACAVEFVDSNADRHALIILRRAVEALRAAEAEWMRLRKLAKTSPAPGSSPEAPGMASPPPSADSGAGSSSKVPEEFDSERALQIEAEEFF